MHQIGWQSSGLEALADLCVQHPDRWADINGAVDIIEYNLQRDPIKHSHHVAEGLRRTHSAPLVAYFTIHGTRIMMEAVGSKE